MKIEDQTINYIEYRTLSQLSEEELVLFVDDSVERKQEIEKLVCLLHQVAQQKQMKQKLAGILRGVSAQKAGNTKPAQTEIAQETSEERLRKAEERVKELEEMLKRMQAKEPEQQIVTPKVEEKIPEPIEYIPIPPAEREYNRIIYRQKEEMLSKIHKPEIVKTSSIFKKKCTVTWDTIYLGLYPQGKEHSVIIKNYLDGTVSVNPTMDHRHGNDKFRKSGTGYYKYQPIRWRVLDIDGNGVAVLFSENILDVAPFHREAVSAHTFRWNDTTLCKWLNGNQENSFISCAFSERERAALVGESDKIRLLSYNEIVEEKYANYGIFECFQKGNLQMEAPAGTVYSEYAKEKHFSYASPKKIDVMGSWWIQMQNTSALYSKDALMVSGSGKIWNSKAPIETEVVGVRPVITVDLMKLGAAWTKGDSIQITRG